MEPCTVKAVVPQNVICGGTTSKIFLLASLEVIFQPPTLAIMAPFLPEMSMGPIDPRGGWKILEIFCLVKIYPLIVIRTCLLNSRLQWPIYNVLLCIYFPCTSRSQDLRIF